MARPLSMKHEGPAVLCLGRADPLLLRQQGLPLPPAQPVRQNLLIALGPLQSWDAPLWLCAWKDWPQTFRAAWQLLLRLWGSKQQGLPPTTSLLIRGGGAWVHQG